MGDPAPKAPLSRSSVKASGERRFLDALEAAALGARLTFEEIEPATESTAEAAPVWRKRPGGLWCVERADGDFESSTSAIELALLAGRWKPVFLDVVPPTDEEKARDVRFRGLLDEVIGTVSRLRACEEHGCAGSA